MDVPQVVNDDQDHEQRETDQQIGPGDSQRRGLDAVVPEGVADAGDQQDDHHHGCQRVEQDVHDDPTLGRQLAVEDVEADVLVVSFGQGRPQIDRPHEGVDGEFEKLRRGRVEHVTGKHLDRDRHQQQNKDPDGQVHFQKIEDLLAEPAHGSPLATGRKGRPAGRPLSPPAHTAGIYFTFWIMAYRPLPQRLSNFSWL